MTRKFEFDDLPVVQTKAGKLRGYSCDDVVVFKGGSYARAQRFQAPVEKWKITKKLWKILWIRQ